MLSVENLTFRYKMRGRPVLDGVNLELKQGEIGILLGRGLRIDEAKAELNGVTLESLVVAERVARAVRKSAQMGKLDLADFPLLLHVDEIITQCKAVNIPWEKFTYKETV